MTCPTCNTEVRAWERLCPVCQHDCGYPNVRAATDPVETDALAERYRGAEESSAKRGCAAGLDALRIALGGSEAVISRSAGQVKALASSDNELYVTFYQLVGTGARRPEATQVDADRLVADNLLFPYYHEHIRFAALSLDGRGVGGVYGDCTMVLKDVAIRERATVFHGNSLECCRQWDLGINRKAPPGYRATWADRDRLAAAKLADAIDPDTDPSAFPGMLLRQGPNPDFVEVHVYGPLHRRSLARVTLDTASPIERPIVAELRASLAAIGVEVEA